MGISMMRAHHSLSLRNHRNSIDGFIQAGFHLEQFVTMVVDTEAVLENVNALYSSLKRTSAQINVSS
jgi:hypothetical protein